MASETAKKPETKTPDKESVLGVGEVEYGDMAIGADTGIIRAEKTILDSNKKAEKAKLNELIRARQEIEKDPAWENASGTGREILERHKREASWKILEQECKVVGKDFEAVKKEIAAESERQWEKSVAAMGYKDGKSYQERQRAAFEVREMPKICDELILGNGNLSENEKRFLLANPNNRLPTGENLGWKSFFAVRRVVLDKTDVAVCSKLGIDPGNISFRKLGFSKGVIFDKEIVVDGLSYKGFDDIAQFNNFLSREKQKLTDEKFGQWAEKTKRDIMEKTVEPYVLEWKTWQLNQDIVGKEKDARKAKRQQKQDQKAADLAERAKGLSMEDRIALLKEMKAKWSEATANPDNSQLSNDIIGIAEKLSGRDLWKEASEKTDYNLYANEEGYMPDPVGQKEFRKYLTGEAQKILEEGTAQAQAETKKSLEDFLGKMEKNGNQRRARASKRKTKDVPSSMPPVIQPNPDVSEKALGNLEKTLISGLPEFQGPAKNPDLGKPKVPSNAEGGLAMRGLGPRRAPKINLGPDAGRLRESTELRMENVITAEAMGKLTGSLAKDAGMISDMFYRIFGERVSPTEFKNLVRSKRYREAAKSGNQLGEWMKGFYEERPWRWPKKQAKEKNQPPKSSEEPFSRAASEDPAYVARVEARDSRGAGKSRKDPY